MEGIKEAIAFITGLAVKAEKPEVVEINGRTYCTKDLRRYDAADKAEPIKATTLTSLVDYIKESREELRDRMIIQVTSATKVLLYSGLLPEPIPAKGRQGLWNWEACLLLRHKGRDSWDRPVYEDENGKLWKDVEPRADDAPKLCSALYNAFDGEPDTPLEVMERYKGKAIIFMPKRDTWTW